MSYEMEMDKHIYVGSSSNRVDGRRKVMGEAHYSSEILLPRVTHAVLVQSTIANGRIMSIDTQAAEAAPGVLGIMTHENVPQLHPFPSMQSLGPGPVAPLQDTLIHYDGQHIGVIIAATLEQATYAATLIHVEYETETPRTDLETERAAAFAPGGSASADTVRGNVDQALAGADVHLDHLYTTPTEHNNPMSPFATVAVWEGDQLTVYDSTQWVQNVRDTLAVTLGIPASNVRVLSHFVGGAFGAGLRAWPHIVLTALAARHVKRPVKLVLTRAQMYTSVGYRPQTAQRIALGATREGKLCFCYY